MQTIKIGKKSVGKNKPCFIIAEAGVNHNGNPDIAKKLVDAAKEAGADAVKFQTFKAEDLVTYGTSMASYQKKNIRKKETQFSMLKKLELSYGNFKEIKAYCNKIGIIFLSTPHTEEAADFLENIVPAFKIGSGDLTNLPFLEKVSKKGKPILLSTGMGTLEEVKEAVDMIKKYNNQLIVLHCTTEYPCPKEDVNLQAMKTLEEGTGCIIGYSDHTEGIEVPIMAASFGAAVIEKHFTLDTSMEGPDHKASLNPSEMKDMIQNIRKNKKIEIPKKILGNKIKNPTEEEIEIAKVVRKSIIAKVDIPNGTKITEDMVTIKRPGTGIEPKKINNVVGRIALKDIKKDEIIRWGKLR